MMDPAVLGDAGRVLAAHAAPVALCTARVLPVTFLCPVFGGQAAPASVRLGLALSLALFLHLGAGVQSPPDAGVALVLGCMREGVFGLALGLLSALPFDAARIAGRWMDLFRGTSAEAALPSAGHRESALGDLLHQLVVALALAGTVLPLIVGALCRSVRAIPLGLSALSEGGAMRVVAVAGAALSTALALAAPVAGVQLAVDCLVGFVSRALPSLHSSDLGPPLRILGGGAVVWLLLGVLAGRVLGGFAELDAAVAALSGAS